MKRPRIAALAFALAAASTGAIAAAGDTWYGTSRDTVVLTTPGEEVVRIYNDPAYVDRDRVIYEERIASPVYVEREYVVLDGPDYVVISREDPLFDPLHPQTGQRVGQGLFNRKGLNDFGA